jgi:hypothetical protein
MKRNFLFCFVLCWPVLNLLSQTSLPLVTRVMQWSLYGFVDPPDTIEAISLTTSDVIGMAMRGTALVALKTDGTVSAWGFGSSYFDAPEGLSNVIAVAGGQGYCLALKSDTTVAPFGNQNSFPTNMPPDLSNIVSVSASGRGCLALRADGTVGAWGDQVANVPVGLTNVVAIAAGYGHNLALKTDGTVVDWGIESTPPYASGGVQTEAPSDLVDVVAIAAGPEYGLALKANGTVTAWGNQVTNVPVSLTNVVAIAADGLSRLALKGDGTIVEWGLFPGSTNVWFTININLDTTNIVAIAAGAYDRYAIVDDSGSLLHGRMISPRRDPEGFHVSVHSQSGRVYRLEYAESPNEAHWTPLPLVAGTGRIIVLTDSTAAGTQRFYRVRRW